MFKVEKHQETKAEKQIALECSNLRSNLLSSFKINPKGFLDIKNEVKVAT